MLFGEFEESEAIAMVQEAIKQGINYIDTAPYYGQGRSEEILGKALKGIPRKAYYIATKVARYEVDVITRFDFSRERTLKSVDHSLQLLGLDSVDIIQVHDIDLATNLDVVLNETLPALQEVVDAGKARYIGVTCHTVGTLKEAVERSTVPISTVLSYARNTLIDDGLLHVLPFFQSKGVGVVNAAGLVMGLLTNDGPQSWHPAIEPVKKLCAEAAAYCKERGVELARLAQYHTMLHPGPATHLVGMNSKAVLRSNLDIATNGLTDLETHVLEDIKSKFLSKIQGTHFEGVEMEEYKEALRQKGKKQ